MVHHTWIIWASPRDTGTWRQGRVWLPRASTKRVPSTAPRCSRISQDPSENHGKTLGKWWLNGVLMGFTLWWCQNSELENGHVFCGFSHSGHGDFPIAMSNYQRVVQVGESWWLMGRYIWVNYSDLTETEPWESWSTREIIPIMIYPDDVSWWRAVWMFWVSFLFSWWKVCIHTPVVCYHLIIKKGSGKSTI